jgi:transposase-like protein
MRYDQSSNGQQFTAEVILQVHWYLLFPVTYRDLELVFTDRGMDIAHTTLFFRILT